MNDELQSMMCGNAHSSFSNNLNKTNICLVSLWIVLSIPLFFIYNANDKKTNKPKNNVCKSIIFSLFTSFLIIGSINLLLVSSSYKYKLNSVIPN